ncbi:hypothetical protein PanWU01x14_219630 [Parasponia andersonii]|uniref:Uncharacterized protein n=1 Tax=Parasponia andersonii TaxID=3476 RepID=A0A2P5BQ73_PARAD|nr:hypothetical protein PanWU01x14_219630 [Parasponia andersonii]
MVSNEFSAAASNKVFNPKELEEPAFVKLKAERDPEKLFHLFKANAHNRIVIENRFAFEDTLELGGSTILSTCWSIRRLFRSAGVKGSL